MSMARSTPAQNERGPASSTERGPTASAHACSAGPMRRSTARALIPFSTVAGRMTGTMAVSTTTRTTATGRPRAANAARQRRRFHVHRQRAGGGELLALVGAADDGVARQHRAVAHPQAEAAQLGDQRRAGAHRDAAVGVADLAGHDDVAGTQRRVQAARDAGDDDGVGRGVAMGAQPLLDVGRAHAAARDGGLRGVAGQRGELGAQCGDDQQPRCGRVLSGARRHEAPSLART